MKTHAEVLVAAKRLAYSENRTWTSLTADERIEYARRARNNAAGMVTFPMWVNPPSKCKTRTFTTVIPKSPRYESTRHGAIKIVKAFPNRPTKIHPRTGLPGFYTRWES